MKKISLTICCIVLAAVLTVACFGCVTQNVSAGPMKELVGTYKLTTYDVTPEINGEDNAESTFEERTEHYIETKGVEAYIVVTGESIGYYFYKDNETAWWAETIEIEYEYVKDNNGNPTKNIREISIKDQVHDGYTYPGAGNESLGFNKKLHNLNYKRHPYNGKWIKVKSTTSVVYSRVSKDTTTAYVNNAIGKTLNMPKHELKKFNGVLSYGFSDSGMNRDLSPYVYCYVDFNNSTYDTTVYYALKADYDAGKRDAELKKTQSYKATVTENNNELLLDIKFKGINDNSVFHFTKGYVSTIARGADYYFNYDTVNDKYFAATESSGRLTGDQLEKFYISSTIDDAIEGSISAYAALTGIE